MKNISHRICRENQNTHFVLKNSFQNRDFYDIIWKNSVVRCRPQMTIWRQHIACLMAKATNTHTLRRRNTHCFSTWTMAARTRLNITFIRTWPVLLPFLRTGMKKFRIWFYTDKIYSLVIKCFGSIISCKFVICCHFVGRCLGMLIHVYGGTALGLIHRGKP
jgi:hypothetical protein